FIAPATMTSTGAPGIALSAGTTFTCGANINTRGMSVEDGAVFMPGTGTTTFAGASNSLITGTASSITFYNLSNAKNIGYSVSTGGSIATITCNNYSQASGGGNFNAPATFNINGNANLNVCKLTAGANIYVGGNWTRNSAAVFVPGTGTVTFNGSGAQTINGLLVSQNFYNLAVAKP